MKKQELERILAKHSRWVTNKQTGAQAEIFNEDFQEMQISEKNLSGIEIYKSNFKNVDFKNVDFQGGKLVCNNLHRCNYNGVNFTNTNLWNCIFLFTSFGNVDFRNVDFRNVDFKNVDFRNVDFKNSILKECTFSDVNFDGVNLTNAKYNILELLLGINWGNLPNDLTNELLRHNNIPFDEIRYEVQYKERNYSPYYMKFHYPDNLRKFRFQDEKEICQQPGELKFTKKELFKRLCKAKNIKI